MVYEHQLKTIVERSGNFRVFTRHFFFFMNYSLKVLCIIFIPNDGLHCTYLFFLKGKNY